MSTCNVDVRWFPFDIQKCELKFGSWTYDGWLLDLQMSDADISGYMPNGEWDLIGELDGLHLITNIQAFIHFYLSHLHPVCVNSVLFPSFQEFLAPEMKFSMTVVKSLIQM